MAKEHYISKLVVGLVFLLVGYLFFANISWLSFDFVDLSEIEFLDTSSRLAKSITSLDFNSFLSIIFLHPTPHPFLTALLLAFFKIIFLPFNPNELLALRAFYFLCYLISLIYIYRLSLFYTAQKKIFSGIIVLLYAFSCPYYYKLLLGGIGPEDLLANAFLFICLDVYLRYRTSLDKKSSNETRRNALLLSVLMACCFFSKYNVGGFIALSIIVDLLCACFIFKRYSIKELKIFYVVFPFCAAIIAWFLSSSPIRGHFFGYLSRRLAINKETPIKLFYYIRILFAWNGPFSHSINGIWKPSGPHYFYHWGQGVIALFCLLTAYAEVIINYKRRKPSSDQTPIMLPLIYVAVNLVFFSCSKYNDPCALLSIIPVMWLIVGHQISGLLHSGDNAVSVRSSLRKIIQRSTTALIFIYLFACVCLQYFGLNQIAYFMKVNNTKQLSKDSHEAIAEIKKFAVDNNCTHYMAALWTEGLFFEQYFMRLLVYRFSLESSSSRPARRGNIKLLSSDEGGSVLFVEISPPPGKEFPDSILQGLGEHENNTIDFYFGGRSYTVNFFYLPITTEYLGYLFEKLKYKHFKEYVNWKGRIY